MAQYQSSLTGPEIDAALTDMAQHDSEAWAVGTRDGAAVTSLDVTYHNNAEYYATQATAAAARAEAAVPAGTSGAVFFDQAQTLTDAQKAQAQSNIGAVSAQLYNQTTAILPYRNSAGYVGFFRIKRSPASSYTCQVLVSGAGRVFTNSNGLYFCQIRMQSGSLANLRVDQLVSSVNAPTFGYWQDTDYSYVGLYINNTSLSAFSVLLFGNPSNNINPHVGEIYNDATMPTGWTTVSITA